MNQQELFELFDEVGNDPASWLSTATALFQSADILKKEHDENTPNSNPILQMNLQQVFVMLRGMGVECLLKAAWAKNIGPLAASGKYKMSVSIPPHDLVQFEQALDERIKTDLSNEERMVLARLSHQIVAGRYPIKLNVHKRTSLPAGESGHQYLLRWIADDEEMFYSILQKLNLLL